MPADAAKALARCALTAAICALSLPSVGRADSPVTSCRIQVEHAMHGPVLTVPIPPEWRGCFADAEVRVADSEGEGDARSVRILRSDGVPQALLWAAPSSSDADAEEEPVALWEAQPLSAQPLRSALHVLRNDGLSLEEAPVSPAAERSFPVHVQWTKYPHPSRPYTLREFRILRARRTETDRDWFAQHRFDIEPPLRRKQKRHAVPPVVGHARTMWHVEEPTTCRLGAYAADSGWFLFVDGEPVADWQNVLPNRSGLRLGRKPVRLAPGLHTVDFFAFVGTFEDLPRPVVARGDTDHLSLLCEETLLPPIALGELRFEQLDEADGTSVRSQRFRRETRVLLENAPGDLVPLPQTPSSAEGEDGGRAQNMPARLAGLSPLDAVPARLDLRSLPLLHPRGEPFRFDCSVRLPKRNPTQPSPVLRVDGVDARDVPVRPGLMSTPVRGPLVHLPVELSFGAQTPHALAVRLLFRQHNMTAPLRVRLISPSEFGPNLVFQGPRLLLDNQPASLIWNAAAPMAAPQAHRASGRVFVLDDFWDVTPTLEAGRPMSAWLADQLGETVRHYGIESVRRQGIPDRVAKFALLAEALDETRTGDTVVFAMGGTDLLAGRVALEVATEFRFLVAVCLENGLRPVLCTVPAGEGPVSPRCRRTALYVKEIAARHDLPVVDAFSRSKLPGEAPFLRVGVPGAELQSAQSRRWFGELMLECL